MEPRVVVVRELYACDTGWPKERWFLQRHIQGGWGKIKHDVSGTVVTYEEKEHAEACRDEWERLLQIES